MRRLTLQMQMSVDGYVAAANPDVDWQIWGWSQDWSWDTALQTRFNETFARIDTILLSRPMLEEGYLDHWGRMAELSRIDGRFAFAKRIVDSQKVVPTNHPVQVPWPGVQVAPGSLPAVVNRLKAQPGNDIICFGGVRFGSALLANGLVDELELYVNPAALGDGKSIFAAGDALSLELLEAQAYDCGIVVCRYRPGHRL